MLHWTDSRALNAGLTQVLPTLNNLLENREMQLDDGRFLTARMVDAGGRLVRVHPDFRVVALGLPTPPWPGQSLDPPLRSRFQARVVPPPPSALAALRRAAPSLDQETARKLALVAEALRLFEAEHIGSSASSHGHLFPSFPHW